MIEINNFTIIAITIIVIAIIVVKGNISRNSHREYARSEKQAGRDGENIAADIIREVLHNEDIFLRNVNISYEERETELDNVIINRYGVFIIEVKNYRGKLYGDADEYSWRKYKTDSYGNGFVKEVRNPIKQVKREVYLLAKYLRDCGFDVWVEGYAYFVRGNSPISCKEVLETSDDIDRAVHTFNKNRLSSRDVEAIGEILSSLQ